MGSFLHRTTKQYLQSADPNGLPEDLSNYISAPDLSAVAGVPPRYWNISGDVVTEMTQPQKDAVDAALLDAARDAAISAEIDNVEAIGRQIVKMMVSELNILRALHGLPDRTTAQVKTQIRNELGS
jgi:hypothetical protein